MSTQHRAVIPGASGHSEEALSVLEAPVRSEDAAHSLTCIPKPSCVKPAKAHCRLTLLDGTGSAGSFIYPSWTTGFALR
jgi:hypothetical protein